METRQKPRSQNSRSCYSSEYYHLHHRNLYKSLTMMIEKRNTHTHTHVYTYISPKGNAPMLFVIPHPSFWPEIQISFCHCHIIRLASLKTHLLSANVAIIKSKWPLWVIITYPLQPLVRFPGLQFFLKRSLTLLFPPWLSQQVSVSFSWARNL